MGRAATEGVHFRPLRVLESHRLRLSHKSTDDLHRSWSWLSRSVELAVSVRSLPGGPAALANTWMLAQDRVANDLHLSQVTPRQPTNLP